MLLLSSANEGKFCCFNFKVNLRGLPHRISSMIMKPSVHTSFCDRKEVKRGMKGERWNYERRPEYVCVGTDNRGVHMSGALTRLSRIFLWENYFAEVLRTQQDFCTAFKTKCIGREGGDELAQTTLTVTIFPTVDTNDQHPLKIS